MAKNNIKTTHVYLSELENDEKLNSSISYGFRSRSGFFQFAMKSLKSFIDKFGLDEGINKFKKKLEVK